MIVFAAAEGQGVPTGKTPAATALPTHAGAVAHVVTNGGPINPYADEPGAQLPARNIAPYIVAGAVGLTAAIFGFILWRKRS